MTPAVEEIQEHMWDDDMDWIYENAGCRCCCYEHTFSDCVARVWGGCRGGDGKGRNVYDHQSLEDWRKFLGMDSDTFYNNGDISEGQTLETQGIERLEEFP